jgi:hypothetical protein
MYVTTEERGRRAMAGAEAVHVLRAPGLYLDYAICRNNGFSAGFIVLNVREVIFGAIGIRDINIDFDPRATNLIAEHRLK